MNVKVEREMRAQVVALARVRGEKDALGSGASAVVRRALADYLAKHKDEIPAWWRDHL